MVAEQECVELGMKKYDAYVRVEEGLEETVHKATVCRIYSNNRKRVSVQDPVLTLVECEEKPFLAVIQISQLEFNSQPMQTLPVPLLHEPNVKIDGQIMTIAMIQEEYQLMKPDWEWNGQFETAERTMLQCLPGQMVEAVNPELTQATLGSKLFKTFVFRTSDLCGLAAVLVEWLQDECRDGQLKKVTRSETYPYRTLKGEASFYCEDLEMPDNVANGMTCCFCPAIRINQISGPEILRHMGAHILKDCRMHGASQPCGLCMNTGGLCKVFLTKSKKSSAIVIDTRRSTCPNLKETFSIKAAAEYKPNSVCTNHPLTCPLCPKDLPAVWKYNLHQHLSDDHHRCTVQLYEDLYQIRDEENVMMKGILNTKPKMKKKKKKNDGLPISEAHTSTMAMREQTTVHKENTHLSSPSLEPLPEHGLPFETDLTNSCDDETASELEYLDEDSAASETGIRNFAEQIVLDDHDVRLDDGILEESETGVGTEYVSECPEEMQVQGNAPKTVHRAYISPSKLPPADPSLCTTASQKQRIRKIIESDDEDYTCSNGHCLNAAIFDGDYVACSSPGCNLKAIPFALQRFVGETKSGLVL
ncbi:hypothetical protein PM082_004334 [Marasmius tenuissimus]|nr:hypothetical protein PM082_004334 [Marasmius tenuissimus]